MLYDGGHDGIIVEGRGSTTYIILDSEQAKSADPVTYDDQGNVIPLSERFNTENEDIRYSASLTDMVKEGSYISKQRANEEYDRLLDELANVTGMPNGLDKVTLYSMIKSSFDSNRFDSRWGDQKKVQDVVRRIDEYNETYRRSSEAYENATPAEKALSVYLDAYGDNAFDEIRQQEQEMVETQQAWAGEWENQDALERLVRAFKATDFSDINSVLRYFDEAIAAFEQDGQTFYVNGVPISRTSIRYSASTESALRRENEELRERAEYWKNETNWGRRDSNEPRPRTIRTEDAKAATRILIEAYDSTLNADDIAADMRTIGNQLLTEDYDTVKQAAVDLARKVVESASVLAEGEDTVLYDKLHAALKRNMSISKEAAAELSPDDWAAYRNSIRGKVNVSITGLGTPVRQTYRELSDAYPDFFPAEIKNEADMVRQMITVAQMEPKMVNPYDYDYAVAIERCANDILDLLMSARETPETYGDRMERKVKEERAKRDQALQEVRANRDQRMQDQAEYYREMVKRLRKNKNAKIESIYEQIRQDRINRRAKKEEREMRQRLLKVARHLKGMKTSLANRALIDEAFGGLDLDTVAMSITDGKVRKLKDLNEYVLDKTVPGRNEEEYDQYFHVSSTTMKALARLQQTQISDLTDMDEVRDLLTALLNVEAQINAEKRFIDSQLAMDFYDAGNLVIGDVQAAPVGKILSLLNPRSAIHRIAWNYRGDSPLVIAYNEMVEGERAYDMYRREALKPFSDILKNHKWLKEFSGKKARTIKVSGLDARGNATTAEITPAMAVALYLSSKNEDNFAHIAGGGVLVPNMADYRAGKMEEAYNSGTRIRLGRDELAKMWSALNENDRTFANLLEQYYNEFAPERLNKTSLALDGYEKYLTKNYYPIHVDKNFLKADFEQGMNTADDSLARPGFSNERQHSTKPIYLYDANLELLRSVKGNGMYATMAVPLHNMNRLLNVTLKNNEGSVMEALNQKYKDGSATRYLKKFLKDYAGHVTTQDTNLDKAIRKLRSNYAKSALMISAGTAAKQFASYLAAGAVVSYKALTRAMNATAKTGNLSFIDEMTAAYTKRAEGFSFMEMAELTEQGKHVPKLLNWIQAVDLGTTKLLKRTAYFDVLSRGEYEEGSEAFKREVVDTYNKIIEQTQPVYSASFRPEILRSENEIIRSVVMFATQPLQNFNVLYDSIQNWRAAAIAAQNTNSAEAKNELRAAQKNAAKAIGSQAASALLFSVLQMLVDYLRGHGDKYRPKDDDDENSALAMLRGIGMNMLTNGVGMIPGANVALQFAEAVTDTVYDLLGKTKPFDERWYGVEVGITEAITTAGDSVLSAIRKIGNAPDDPMAAWQSGIKAAGDILTLFGIPLKNIYRTGTNAIKTVFRLVKAPYIGEYYALRVTESIGDSEYYDNLYKAYQSGARSYRELYDLMIADGFDDDKIHNAMETRMKAAQGVSSVEDLDHRYMGPDQQDYYDGVLKKVRNAGIWNDLDADLRDKAKDLIYYLAINSNESSAKTAREKVEGGESVGLSMDEYIIYWLARQYYDQPVGVEGHGGYDRDELIKAIDSVPGLSIDEKSYLWTTYNPKTHTDKNNPYR